MNVLTIYLPWRKIGIASDLRIVKTAVCSCEQLGSGKKEKKRLIIVKKAPGNKIKFSCEHYKCAKCTTTPTFKVL